MSDDLARLKSIFAEAVGVTDIDGQAAFVQQACSGDPDLRERVEALLAAHAGEDSFLQLPADAEPTELCVLLSESPGSKIGRYKLLEQIGEGGFGVVFMAEQESPMRRLVALKVIKLGMDTRQVVARFEAERQALALMDHPNVAKVFDGGATETGRPYFVMELVKGVPITEYCDQQRLGVRERLELFDQVCQAVQHAHQKGLIHRDLKPTNVLVTVQDDRPVVKVIDFGVAKAMEKRLTDKTLFTEFRQLIGTPSYMSPEQAAGGLDVDTRSDVYSLGVLLYELLTGTPPFDAKELRSRAFAEMQRIICEMEPPTPSSKLQTRADALPELAAKRQAEPRRLLAALRGELDWIVMRSLEKDRTRRYQSAGELAEDLRRYLGNQPIEARPATRLYRLRKFVRRYRLAVMSGAVAVAALCFGLTLATIGLLRASHQAAIARTEAVRSEQVAGFLKRILNSAGANVTRGRDATVLIETLESTARDLEKNLQDQPDVRGDLWSTLGATYVSIGNYNQAAEMYQRATDDYRIAFGEKSLKLAQSLAQLGRARSFIGNSHVGQPIALSGLEMAREFDDQRALVDCLMCAARSEGMYGKIYPTAEPLWREALAIQRKLNDDPSVLISCLNGLAMTLYGRNKDEAESLHREALDLCRRHASTDNPDYAHSLMQLGELLNLRGDFQEAEVLLHEANEKYKKLFDRDHPFQPVVLRFYLQSLENQGKHAQADEVIRKQIKLDPIDVDNYQVLSSLHCFRGEWNASLEPLRHLIKKPSDRVWLQLRLSAVLMNAERIDEYRTICRQTLSGSVTPWHKQWAATIALVLPVEGDDLHRAYALADEVSQVEDKTFLFAYTSLAKALAEYRRGRHPIATQWADRAIEAKVPSKHCEALARIVQSMAAAKSGRNQAAKDLLAQCHASQFLVRPKSLNEFWDADWCYRTFAEHLRREAVETINQHAPGSRP